MISVLASATVKPYFQTHRIGILWVVVSLGALAIELAGAGRRRAEATRKDRGSQIFLRICTVPAVVFLFLAPGAVPGAEIHPPLVSVIVGIVIFAAGEGMRVWAKTALGRYFTYTVQTSTDQPVITTGPYRFVRHPSYSGLWMMGIGAGFVFGNWAGLAVLTVALLVGIVYRITVEERALLADLGERYRTYAEHHKRLVPFVW